MREKREKEKERGRERERERERISNIFIFGWYFVVVERRSFRID